MFTLEPGRFGLLQAHLLQEVHSGVDEENRVLSAVQTKRGGDYCGHRLSLSVLSVYAERVSPLFSLRPKTQGHLFPSLGTHSGLLGGGFIIRSGSLQSIEGVDGARD